MSPFCLLASSRVTRATPDSRNVMVSGSCTAAWPSLIVLRTTASNWPSLNFRVVASRAYGETKELEALTSSANARLRLQKPDWSQVLKFSCLTDTGSPDQHLFLTCAHLG